MIKKMSKISLNYLACMLNESLRTSIFARVWKDDLVAEINGYLDQISHWFMENEEELSVGK